MTRQEFEEKSFEDVMSKLNEESNGITTLNILKEFAKLQINEGRYFLVKHIIEALENGNDEYWWGYDYNMGTLEEPSPIKNKQDIEDLGYLIED